VRDPVTRLEHLDQDLNSLRLDFEKDGLSTRQFRGSAEFELLKEEFMDYFDGCDKMGYRATDHMPRSLTDLIALQQRWLSQSVRSTRDGDESRRATGSSSSSSSRRHHRSRSVTTEGRNAEPRRRAEHRDAQRDESGGATRWTRFREDVAKSPELLVKAGIPLSYHVLLSHIAA